jgi:[ribosomal protein S18]-alanine N-acetyltransferase
MSTIFQPQMRWLIRRDLPEILRIDFEAMIDPWREEDFLVFLRQRPNIGIVAECGRTIVGFMLYELKKYRLVVHRFAVAPTHQRQGVGAAMIGRLIDRLSDSAGSNSRPASQRREVLECVVREDGPGAFFLRACGFRCMELMREEFGYCDGYRMEFRL